MAMRLWSSQNSPCNYNTWQSLYFQLVRQGYTDEVSQEEVTRETASERQQRLKAMYAEIQAEVHGPDYVVLAARASAASARAAAKAAPPKRPATITETVALTAGVTTDRVSPHFQMRDSVVPEC